jgi:hypothetical protein
MSTAVKIVKRPDEYAGDPRCFICGMSPDGVFFANCATVLPDGTIYTHDETCQKYGAERDRSYPADWLCSRCSAEEDAWLAAHSTIA